MEDLYPSSWSEWVALFGILGPLIIWAGSSAGRAYTYYQDLQQRRWKRLQELASILYNKDYEKDGFAQLAAAHELAKLKVSRRAKEEIAFAAIDIWQNPQGNFHLLTALGRIARK